MQNLHAQATTSNPGAVVPPGIPEGSPRKSERPHPAQVVHIDEARERRRIEDLTRRLGYEPNEQHVDAALASIRDGRGDHYARSILVCPPFPEKAIRGRRNCRRVHCPSCAERRASREADWMRRAAEEMKNPIAVRFAVRGGLLEGLGTLRAKLRRFGSSRRIRGLAPKMAGLIHVKHVGGAIYWVHVHGVIDGPGSIEEVGATLTETWGNGAWFKPLESARAMSIYAASLGAAKSWRPQPGDGLPDARRREVLEGMRGRRVRVSWGLR